MVRANKQTQFRQGPNDIKLNNSSRSKTLRWFAYRNLIGIWKETHIPNYINPVIFKSIKCRKLQIPNYH